MDATAIVIAVCVGAAVAIVAGCTIAARLRSQATADRDAAVGAAVDTMLRLAGERLGHQAAAGSKELQIRQEAFDQGVARVGEELAAMSALVQDLRRDAASQHGDVTQRLEAVAQSSTALSQTAQHLREALSSPKQRGQWGERMAEDVLRVAGFVEGVSYRRQRALGSGSIPDFAFLLPGDLEVRMDVKFPLDNYLRVLDSEAAADVERFSRAFVRDVRNRIRELAARDYIDGRDTVDVVLLFIPNEAVYAFLHEAEPALLDEALVQKVVMCSPATLFAVLAVIRQAVDHFQLERTSDEILRCLGGVTDQWGRLTTQLDLVEKKIEGLSKCFGEVQGTRRRQLQRELDAVERLRSRALDDDRDAASGLRALPGGAEAAEPGSRQAG